MAKAGRKLQPPPAPPPELSREEARRWVAKVMAARAKARAYYAKTVDTRRAIARQVYLKLSASERAKFRERSREARRRYLEKMAKEERSIKLARDCERSQQGKLETDERQKTDDDHEQWFREIREQAAEKARRRSAW